MLEGNAAFANGGCYINKSDEKQMVILILSSTEFLLLINQREVMKIPLEMLTQFI